MPELPSSPGAIQIRVTLLEVTEKTVRFVTAAGGATLRAAPVDLQSREVEADDIQMIGVGSVWTRHQRTNKRQVRKHFVIAGRDCLTSN